MINPPVCLQGEAEQRQIIFMFRNVGPQELKFLAIILGGDLLTRRCVEITEDDESSALMEDINSSSANPIRTTYSNLALTLG